MTSVAVIALVGKSPDGGLGELREVLAREGFRDPRWFEVEESRKAPECARQAIAAGADVLFVWGGDAMLQRCIDAVAGSEADVAILPAGMANPLAINLGIPTDVSERGCPEFRGTSVAARWSSGYVHGFIMTVGDTLLGDVALQGGS